MKSTLPQHPIIPSSLVQEDHGLSQVGSSLDDVDDAFRADPWQLFGLGLLGMIGGSSYIYICVCVNTCRHICIIHIYIYMGVL